MSDQQTIQPRSKKGLFRFSIRWGTYCGISFFVCLGIVTPKTAILAWIIVFLFSQYLVVDTLKAYSQLEHHIPDKFMKALSFTYLDFVCFFISVMVGILGGIL